MRSVYQNASKWLARLGIHYEGADASPQVRPTVQPVSIVSDQRGLWSPMMGPAGLVGGEAAENVARVPAFTLQAVNRAVWCRMTVSQRVPSGVPDHVLHGIGSGAAPALSNPNATAPALMAFDPSQPMTSRVQCGTNAGAFPFTPAAAASAAFRAAFEPITLPWVLVSPGRYAWWSSDFTNQRHAYSLVFYELPPDLGNDG